MFVINLLFLIALLCPNKKGAKNKLDFDKNIYKKRIIIEHTFQKLKIFRRINIRYDSYIKTYLSFLLLASSKIIFDKL